MLNDMMMITMLCIILCIIAPIFNANVYRTTNDTEIVPLNITSDDFKINSSTSAPTLLEKINDVIEQSIFLCMNSTELFLRCCSCSNIDDIDDSDDSSDKFYFYP
uniref:Bm1101 n=2 Tax=Brugia malayi TaxID=6279 RepID=A0A912GRX0_BRUMA